MGCLWRGVELWNVRFRHLALYTLDYRAFCLVAQDDGYVVR